MLSAVYLKREQWRKAEQTAIEALATDDSEPANALALYKILVTAYIKLGESDKSLAYFEKHNELQSTWSNKHFQSALSEMEVKYETEKKEMEIERQKNVIAHQNMQRGLLAAGIAVCVVVLILLWYMLQLRTRRNLALSERNEAISQRADALSERTNALSEMNATKDKLFSIISHDLKNPAVSLRDAIQTLFDNGSLWNAETLTRYYDKLLQSANNQVELLYNLLGWAQLQTGRMIYTPAPFDLAAHLRGVVNLISDMAEKKCLTLTANMPQIAILTGDRNMLAIIVRNLLTNAVKFTKTGGTVTLSVEPASEGNYTIAVSDTGIGMNHEQISKLFRLDSTHSHKGTAGEQGSGLGLIVCRELLEKQGTTLHVESEEGKGSRFWFEVNGES